MKTLIKTFLVAAAVSAAPAAIAASDMAGELEFCLNVETVAGVSMLSRQNGTPKSYLLRNVDSEIAHIIADLAYRVPVYASDSDKADAVKAYGDDWFKRCVDVRIKGEEL